MIRRSIVYLLMRVIPWRCWGWQATTRLMRVTYLLSREEFDRLASEHERRR